MNKTFDNMSIKPDRLKPGDTIGIIAPGFSISEERLQNCVTNIKSLGFKPYYTDRIIGHYGYLSNTDEERLADLHEHFANKEVKAIFCARGGYGCTRILSKVDFNLIKSNPKIFLGFSDITALLNSIYEETGLITFHGPVAATLDNDFVKGQVKQMLMNPEKNIPRENILASNPYPINNSLNEYYTIKPGELKGILAGGNLSLVTAMIGTPYEIDFTDKIVFLEDVGEKPYRIDRMLTQLIEAGMFKDIKGIIFGTFEDCKAPKDSQSFTLKEVILNRIKPLDIPAAYGFTFGHISQNLILPIGGNTLINTTHGTISIEEKMVH